MWHVHRLNFIKKYSFCHFITYRNLKNVQGEPFNTLVYLLYVSLDPMKDYVFSKHIYPGICIGRKSKLVHNAQRSKKQIKQKKKS